MALFVAQYLPLPTKTNWTCCQHDDVIKWKHFPRNWPFVRGIHRSPVNFPHKGQWRGALMFSLIYAWINDWVNNHEAGDLRRQHGHYDVIVMSCKFLNKHNFNHKASGLSVSRSWAPNFLMGALKNFTCWLNKPYKLRNLVCILIEDPLKFSLGPCPLKIPMVRAPN